MKIDGSERGGKIEARHTHISWPISRKPRSKNEANAVPLEKGLSSTRIAGAE